MQAQTRALTLSEAVLPKTGVLRDVALVVGFGVLTAILAQVAIYVTPLVPITGQTLGVLLSGAVLGSRRGALSQLAYLGAGAMGLPVLAAGHSGLPYMMGPTAGYLVGFVAAAYVIGLLAERGWDRRVWTMAVAMLVGSVIIHAFGLARLSTLVPFERMFGSYLLPFVPGDLIKTALAAGAFPSAWALLRRGEN